MMALSLLPLRCRTLLPNSSFFAEHTSSSIFSFPTTMAPPKTSAPKKGKAPAQASQPAAASGSVEPAAVLPKSRIGSVGVDKVRFLAASNTNEHGATGMKPASYGSKRGNGYYPIFIHSFSAGLIPPFSDFLEAILET